MCCLAKGVSGTVPVFVKSGCLELESAPWISLSLCLSLSERHASLLKHNIEQDAAKWTCHV